jgi:hypothetical protein
MFLQDINEIRSIDFERGYLWDIRFEVENIPSPFDRWFPAVDVEEPINNLNVFTFEAGNTNIQVPQSTNNLELKVTFYDDIDHTLLYWIRSWYNAIVGVDYVSVLEDSVKSLRIAKLDLQRKPILNQTQAYWVYPKGELSYHGTSTSEITPYIVNFVVSNK